MMHRRMLPPEGEAFTAGVGACGDLAILLINRGHAAIQGFHINGIAHRPKLLRQRRIFRFDACWPFHDFASASRTSATSEKVPTGMTGPNCSSVKRRMLGVTG